MDEFAFELELGNAALDSGLDIETDIIHGDRFIQNS
jgi:hypothetical protein